ncbi:MAG: exodeoxyribonuclease III [Deltaproteobacteria bacterium]|nr:exodeoxyribonuclease III [Deltaproteobacteria bacterium]
MAITLESFLLALEQEVAGYHTPVVDLIAVQTRDPFGVLVATILSAHKVPDDLEQLLKLPGVGRKTANLVLATAFDKPAICVDTHVHRIMNIWGFVGTGNPEATEKALCKILPVKYWKKINSILVAFGQERCKPIGPQCDICLFEKDCPKTGVTPRRLKGSADTLKLISWNVNGLRAIAQKGFTDIVPGTGADIFALQETRAWPEQLGDEIKNIPGYTGYFAPAKKKGYAGVAVYARQKPLQVITGVGVDRFDCEGRVLTLEFVDFFLINVYVPNAQHELKRLTYKLEFNEALSEYATKLALKKTTVICGDFNVAHKTIDLANHKANENNPGFSIEERSWMDRFVNAGWIDTFRVFNQDPGQYSWWSYRFNARTRNIGWRLDYFVIDADSRPRLQGAAILRDITGSDHCPVQMELKIGAT